MAESEHTSGAQERFHRHAMHCANCGHELHGPYCARCGQPVRSFIRAVWGLIYELLDEFFSFDSRAFRTFPPLLLRPGYLTNEYIAGRRARYVRPLRLYLIISITSFLVVTVFAIDETQFEDVNVNIMEEQGYEQTISDLERALRRLKNSLDEMPEEEGERTRATIKALEDELVVLRELAAREAAPDEEEAAYRSIFDWDEKRVEAYANEQARRVARNPGRFIDKLFGALPQAMFLLLPLFALLLKIVYVFKRRYYTEHLIVALHSHSFLFLAFLLLYLISVSTEALSTAVSGSPDGVIVTIGHWLGVAVSIWIPVYLFLMQKRVYKQGWIMTFLKFGLVGIVYITLLSLTLAAAALVGFATT